MKQCATSRAANYTDIRHAPLFCSYVGFGMWGLSGVLDIVVALLTGKRIHTMELSEMPNMPFLYWLAVVGAVVKPKWTTSKTFPALEVCDVKRIRYMPARSIVLTSCLECLSSLRGCVSLIQLPFQYWDARLKTCSQFYETGPAGLMPCANPMLLATYEITQYICASRTTRVYVYAFRCHYRPQHPSKDAA